MERYSQFEILGRIENLLWLNAGLLFVIAAFALPEDEEGNYRRNTEEE